MQALRSARHLAWGLALLAWVLSGCSSMSNRDALRGRIFLAIGASYSDRLSPTVIEERISQANQLIKNFQTLHPGVEAQINVFIEADLQQAIAKRNATGLGPDLIFLDGMTAHSLAIAGMVRPMRFPQTTTDQIEPASFDRLRLSDGSLAGLPVLLEPQIACFNRARLAQSPTSLQGLLELAETGIEVGLSLESAGLYWTAGPLGAEPALKALALGQAITPAQRERIRFWLKWIQTANLLQHINYYGPEEDLVQGLMKGRLDWIPCHSNSLVRLRQQLGQRLAVASLPGDFAGPATPITRERVWAFGVNSSANQRRIAEAFATFTVNPLIQRSITIAIQNQLPVNRHVPPPVASSAVLEAMVTSEQQGRASEEIVKLVPPLDQRRRQLAQLMMRLVFGEISPDQATDALIKQLGKGAGR
jgi:ABC-type glycerol-3-phosphate transport system substrate-binding protein